MDMRLNTFLPTFSRNLCYRLSFFLDYFKINSFFLIFIGVELIYNVVLVSGIEQSESYIYIYTHISMSMYVSVYACIHIYMSPFFSDSFPIDVTTEY